MNKLRFKHRTLITLSGLVWFCIGVILLIIGFNLVISSIFVDSTNRHFSLLPIVLRFVRSAQNGIILLLTLSLLTGSIIGRAFLSNKALKQIKRIKSLPEPTKLLNIYPIGYCIIIACITLVGVTIKYFPLTYDTGGAIDIVVGSALMNGSMSYFRYAINYYYIKHE